MKNAKTAAAPTKKIKYTKTKPEAVRAPGVVLPAEFVEPDPCPQAGLDLVSTSAQGLEEFDRERTVASAAVNSDVEGSISPPLTSTLFGSLSLGDVFYFVFSHVAGVSAYVSRIPCLKVGKSTYLYPDLSGIDLVNPRAPLTFSLKARAERKDCVFVDRRSRLELVTPVVLTES